MHPGKRNEHHAWRPHIDAQQDFNPFSHASHASFGGLQPEYRPLDEWDEYAQESEAQPAEVEEAALRKRSP